MNTKNQIEIIMERTRYRFVLPENIMYIEDLRDYQFSEMIYISNVGWRVVYYVSEEDYNHCNCTQKFSGYRGSIDREWMGRYDKLKEKNENFFLNDLCLLPQIICREDTVVVYAAEKRLTAEFLITSSEKLFDRERSLNIAQSFCNYLKETNYAGITNTCNSNRKNFTDCRTV